MDHDLLAANEAFYEAFRQGDVSAMDAIWARHTEVQCAHPGWAPLQGRDRVMASWRAILGGGAPPVQCGDARVHRLGDGAFVICEERLPGVRLLATNVFVLEDDGWRMIHHHAGMIAEREEAEEPPKPSSLN